MFFSEAILSKRGPLAKVWLAAHMERKLSKTQTLQTDIEESVDAIMGQEIEVMALRLSGQLLLGVVRIYSRKAKYLLDDCNEALLKIKMAFRPGVVDMTEDQLAVNRNAITLQEGNVDLDLLLPNVNWDVDFEDRPQQTQGQHVARLADITLTTANDFQFDLDDPGYGFDLGVGDGIGSQDYDVDLGIDFGDGPSGQDETRLEDDSLSLEIGRDAPPRLPRDSIDTQLLGDAHGRDEFDFLSNKEPSEHGFGDMDFGMDLTAMDVDLGINFGDDDRTMETDGAIEADKTMEVDVSAAAQKVPRSPSVASSRLTTPPATPPPEAPHVAEEPESAVKATKKRNMNKKQIVDQQTTLESGLHGFGSQTEVDVSSILTEPHFLPRSRTVMRLLEIQRDPLSHFLPSKTTPNGSFFFAGPPGLAPELGSLFMRPIMNHLASKKRGASPQNTPSKRPRLDGQADETVEIEFARRDGSHDPSFVLGSDILGRGSIGLGVDGTFDFADTTGGGLDDFHFDVDMNTDPVMVRERSKSRLSTPAVDGEFIEEGVETYADSSCPIALFDDKVNQSQSQGADKEDVTAMDSQGYSKNTVKALGIIRKDLHPTAGEGLDKIMSFQQMSHKASRRAASAFFFELLVLGTRDCVALKQSGPFENIEIRAREKLWERQGHAASQATPARVALAAE